MPPLGSTISERLDELGRVLENLPHSLPEPKLEDSRFQFANYVPDPDDVDIFGTPDAAINHALEVVFGWEARSQGVLPIAERGKGVCSLVDALRAYQRHCKNPESDAILGKWIEDIWEGAKVAYSTADEPRAGHFYRCVGEGCDWFKAGHPQSKRLLRHSTRCRKLGSELRAKAIKWSASESLGAKVGKRKSKSDPHPAGTEQVSETPSASEIQAIHTLATISHNSTVALGREELRQRIDFRIMKLVCIRNIVPSVVDSKEWKDMWRDGNAKYQPTSSSTFINSHIPAEAAQIRTLQVELLKKLINLTLTYDGGTINRPQSVYTIHITTPDRRVYFIDGDECSKERHTAEYLEKLIFEIMSEIGIERFSGICSDNTGNTRKARELLAKSIPGLINMLDCCHHLHNTSKDITNLSDFKTMISNLRKIVKYFRKSPLAAALLTDARMEEGIARGLQSVGRTRFATFYWSAESLKSSLPVMRQLVSSGKISLKNATFDTALLQGGNMASMSFERDLFMYTTILTPIARSLKALESTDATAADVFVFWLGIVSTLDDLFQRPEFETGISQSLIKKVTTIINTRYKEIIDSTPTDVYFTAFFLHPKHSRSDILRKPVNPLANVIIIPSARARGKQKATGDKGDDSENAPIPRAYRRAKEYLKRQLQEEIVRNAHPLIKKLGVARAAEELRAQLMAYAHGQYPFDTPLEETESESGRPVLEWWQNLESHAHARVLAMLAIKLYSIAINSMADERTASNFTWFNSSLRNRQQVGTLVDMIQVRQWYLTKVQLQY
ncbi:ribonuclease H-like domain-containing protein [Dichomitus squalens]|uniref:Ribonuclease H-like domain-containing protein n=1 Tax=Dichomitus squalens TaxID=114155 RepID=A0A4Q9PME5_9APHY|nr:ribonuclease H-like domain-containing protein [Dichomitus squalens]